MRIKIDLEQKQVILESGEELSIGAIFNFLHEIDADNVDQWTIVSESGDCFCNSDPFNVPCQPIYPGDYFEITCFHGQNIDSTGQTTFETTGVSSDIGS